MNSSFGKGKSALIIGGTSGLGKELSNLVSQEGYEVTTVSRSKPLKPFPHFRCDVGNVQDWRRTLRKVKKRLSRLDLLVCVVGFARAGHFASLSFADWMVAFQKNVLYVAMAIQTLLELLKKGESPRVVTMGSKWSYQVGADKLATHTVAKHALKALVEDTAARYTWLKINHFCLPAMDTTGYWEEKASFRAVEENPVVNFTVPDCLALPEVIARAVMARVLLEDVSGRTYYIKEECKVR